MNRSYRELRRLDTFEERFRYLSIGGIVGSSTFGFDRWINQRFYTSREWRRTRQAVIARDNGCDLGVEGYEIHTQILVHHMNPFRVQDFSTDIAVMLEPSFLVTTTLRTHNAIHFGNESHLPRPLADRKAGDTKMW